MIGASTMSNDTDPSPIETLGDYIKRTVDAAPPLTDEQLQRLAAILRPPAGSSPSVAPTTARRAEPVSPVSDPIEVEL